MNIIIVGCGKVGYAIAGQLTQEKEVDSGQAQEADLSQ